jgi:hypothetical protein
MFKCREALAFSRSLRPELAGDGPAVSGHTATGDTNVQPLAGVTNEEMICRRRNIEWLLCRFISHSTDEGSI